MHYYWKISTNSWIIKTSSGSNLFGRLTTETTKYPKQVILVAHSGGRIVYHYGLNLCSSSQDMEGMETQSDSGKINVRIQQLWRISLICFVSQKIRGQSKEYGNHLRQYINIFICLSQSLQPKNVRNSNLYFKSQIENKRWKIIGNLNARVVTHVRKHMLQCTIRESTSPISVDLEIWIPAKAWILF